ncbi:hypothetical protein FRC16_011069 [Serendipita sp. 398]|nr:hypothetical protein FRC16_011069 [Serendipita sp. 398]
MSFSPLETPLNTVFVASICYSLFKVVWPSVELPAKLPTEHTQAYNWMPPKHQNTTVFRTYTPKTLEPFHGRDGGPILLAIDRNVFDVTKGKNFYGPGITVSDGMYGNFAGRDASRGMAKQSFDLEMLTPIDQPIDKLEDLDQTEVDNMNGWISHFKYKYPIVGRLMENDDV